MELTAQEEMAIGEKVPVAISFWAVSSIQLTEQVTPAHKHSLAKMDVYSCYCS